MELFRPILQLKYSERRQLENGFLWSKTLHIKALTLVLNAVHDKNTSRNTPNFSDLFFFLLLQSFEIVEPSSTAIEATEALLAKFIVGHVKLGNRCHPLMWFS